jgi:hypothetical protein
MGRDYSAIINARRTAVVRKWVATLGPAGFDGTVQNLAAALRRHADRYTLIGDRPTAAVELALRGTPFVVTRYRRSFAACVTIQRRRE